MNRILLAGLALGISTLPALAQTTPNQPSTQPATTQLSSTETPAAAVPGANSFTQAQARGRLEKNGYTQVSGLSKGDDGIWRGTAMKNGSSVKVGVDYKGDISVN